MPKVSKYIENKSHVLFDMYRQLSDIKGGKAYKEGDTAVVRSRVARREGRWHGLWAVAVSGTGGVAVAAQLCNHLSATHLIPPNPPLPPAPPQPTRLQKAPRQRHTKRLTWSSNGADHSMGVYPFDRLVT